jgi:peptide/nickel transport system ATP-binding protein
VSGEIVFDGIRLLDLVESDLAAMRGKRIAMIFQDPGRALNPVFSIGQQLLAVYARHHLGGAKSEFRSAAAELLNRVGLSDGDRVLGSYPFQLSGGMQQRAMIAIALAGDPELLIADEPTTALDVTIQAQILDLLAELQAVRGLTVALITHDIGVIARSCQEVAVLYAGRVVERGSVRDVLRGPRHPYSRGLLASMPTAVPPGEPIQTIVGSVPSALGAIHGCSFRPRCPAAHERCLQQPPNAHVGEATVECWLYVDQPSGS